MGPKTKFAQYIHKTKHREEGESYEASVHRLARGLADNETHYQKLFDIFGNQRFLPGGRVQASIGSKRNLTAMNCFISPVIEDSLAGIMRVATDAAHTMQAGGGVGYDFSTIRPRGSPIKTLGSQASGPVSFMEIFNGVCKSIASAGHRRGAQMGVLRCDHPDIFEFIEAKQNSHALTAFNVSIAVTDKFMWAVKNDQSFTLSWNDKYHKKIQAKELWAKIMESTYDWAEPGIIFIDTVNNLNNINYCETIAATNPCGEVPMGANSACLLGSFNLPQYVSRNGGNGFSFNYSQFCQDIPHIVRALDNVNDRTNYPLVAQREMARAKRRLGIGVTGLANALEAQGMDYGDMEFVWNTGEIFKLLAHECYEASAYLAREKGSFPLYDADKYGQNAFASTLAPNTRSLIKRWGMRNSHVMAVAPTGTISLGADNVSGGIEPVFAHSVQRTVQTFDGPQTHQLDDYAWREWQVRGKTASEVTVDEHLAVLAAAQKWTDQAISKTVNVPQAYPYEDFAKVYMRAWEAGCKGVATFRDGGKRFGVLQAAPKAEEPQACYFDPATGEKSCG